MTHVSKKKRSISLSFSSSLEKVGSLFYIQPLRVAVLVFVVLALAITVVVLGVRTYMLYQENSYYEVKLKEAEVLLGNLNVEYKKLSSEIANTLLYDREK